MGIGYLKCQLAAIRGPLQIARGIPQATITDKRRYPYRGVAILTHDLNNTNVIAVIGNIVSLIAEKDLIFQES